MSCHGCADAFGFWKREIGCPNCGFSYCQKCLRYKITVPDPENKAILEKVVCSQCYLTVQEKKEPHLSPTKGGQAIAAAKAVEVLETMEDPTKHPITVYREERFSNLKRGLSTEDQKLVDRLEGLRNFSKDSGRRTSDQPEHDIAARLAKLKGMEYMPSSGNSSILLKQKPQTEDELLKQFADEVALNKDYDDQLISDLEVRLAKLRGNGSSDSDKDKGSQSSECTGLPAETEKSEGEQIDDIINRYTKEVELEAKLKADGGEDNEEENEDMEMEDDLDDVDKLCRICDEKRATMLCKECDGDIFCRNCFIEFHNEIGESHKPSPVKSSQDDEDD